jgi:hypothetical protein
VARASGHQDDVLWRGKERLHVVRCAMNFQQTCGCLRSFHFI